MVNTTKSFTTFFIILLIISLSVFLDYKYYQTDFLPIEDDLIDEQEEYRFSDKEIVYLDSYNKTAEEKFITYLPHSGFHNQRMAAENAIFLAWFLNRTLILPPIIFFSGISPFGMSPFDRLSRRLTKLKPGQTNFTECGNQCITANYTLYHWEELMNMRWIKERVKIVYRKDFDRKNLLKILNIEEQEVFYTKDQERFHHRYYDSLNSTIGLREFKERIDLAKLKDRKEKLFHFGSLFSTRRVVRELPESIEFWHKLIGEFVPDNPVLIQIVNKITEKIGERKFLGVHIRLHDRQFEKIKNHTIESLMLKMSTDYKEYENTFNSNISTEIEKEIEPAVLKEARLEENPLFKNCSSKFTNYTLPLVIYLATDGNRTVESLKPVLEKLPCTFILEDFKEDCESLRSLENPIDHVNMYRYLIPLVDLMVSSRGIRFYGTYSSTFSWYARRLNDLFNNRFQIR